MFALVALLTFACVPHAPQLEQGKDALARVKTTAIVFEDYMVEVFNMMTIYCQTIVQRKDVMKLQE